MITQRFNSSLEDWDDTVQISKFWVNSRGHLDSLSIQGSPSQTEYYVYRDWQPVLATYTVSWADFFPLQFHQLGLDGLAPTSVVQYRKVDVDTFIISTTESFVIDRRLDSVLTRKYTQTGEVWSWSKDIYSFTPQGQIERVVTRDNTYDPKGSNYEQRFIWHYDSINRPISVASGIFETSRKRLSLYDSQSFFYSVDGDLTRAVWTDVDGTQRRFEYHGWQNFEWMINPMLAPEPVSETLPILLGGEEYQDYSLYSRDSVSNIYQYNHRRSKQYDSQDRLLSDLVVDSSNAWTKKDWTYYPNGDLLSIKVSHSGSQKLTQDQRYENTYLSDGSLSQSILKSFGRPYRRYLFLYNNSQSAIRSKQELPEPNSFGSTSELTSGNHKLVIASVLGATIREDNVAGRVHLLTLPSGLYFISIDGGKPRKHLIP